MWKQFTPAGVLLSWLVLVVWLVACTPTQPPVLFITPPVTHTPTPRSIAQMQSLPALVTFTPIPSLTNTPPPNSTPTATFTPSVTPSPTSLFTSTPTSVPQIEPVFATLDPTNLETITPVFTAVPTLEIPDEITNILLLGSDTNGGVGRTDTIIIVSINTTQATASMVSIPRDLYVAVPGWIGNRINTVVSHGDDIGYAGGGVQYLRDTILFNFGIPIHYYARVDFNGFTKIIDAIGGVEIVVSCGLTDWRLKSPELDITVEENWEMYELQTGVHQMDGDLALWYARSRRTTSDFDRGRRQQQLLRAILNKGVDVGLVTEIPTLWQAFNETVETDLDIGRMLQLATIAPTIRDNGIQHLYLTHGELKSWTTPDSGAQVQLLDWEKAEKTFQRLYQPPSLNRANRAPIFVEIINASGNPDRDRVAADMLAWYGFAPVISPPETISTTTTTVTYYGSNLKGSYDWLVSWLFSLRRADITLAPPEESEYNYQVVLGADYSSCRNPLYAPLPTDE